MRTQLCISADSHVVEPPELFEPLKKRFGERAPHIRVIDPELGPQLDLGNGKSGLYISGLLMANVDFSDPSALERVRARVEALGGRAQMIHADLTDNEIKNLVRACDVFVSLHRSEGYGLGIAQAMALGRPAVATGYSGNLDFMAPGTALAVDYHLVPVPNGAYPQGDGQQWAQPDPDHASRLIEGLLDDPSGAWALGQAAKRHARQTLSHHAVGQLYAARLNETPTEG